MKIAVCFVCVWLASKCTNAQDYSHIDSLSILFEVYHMSGFDKRLFIGAHGGDSALYIMYTPGQNDAAVYPPLQEKYKSLFIFFYPRSYVIGFRIVNWMVIDSFEIANSKAKLMYKIITSSDSWIEKKDEVLSVGNIKLELQNGKWVIVNRKIRRT